MKLGLPPPVADLQKVPAEIHMLPTGTRLVRLYYRGGDHPTTWHAFRAEGPLNGRFDHQLPREAGARRTRPSAPPRAILYAALDALTCLAEVYQDTRQIDRQHKAPWMAVFDLNAPLKLQDLSGRWPTRAGTSGALATGRRDYAQAWSRHIYEAYPDIHGLYCRSSMDPRGFCIALYERAGGVGALPRRPLFNRSLADASWEPTLENAAGEIVYLLV